MNPLTNIRNIAALNDRELAKGVFDHKLSWHSQYKDSAYVFVGGLPYDLTEGDILCVFSQYGEIVNVNLIRDKKTGKSKGFCFIAFEDQRSTILVVDNFNGIKLGGRTIRVDHVEDYRRPKEKDEDGTYKDVIEEGCAPRTPSPPPPEDDLEGKMKKAKRKKKKKEKKTKREKIDSSDDNNSKSRIKREVKEEPEVKRIKQEPIRGDTPAPSPPITVDRSKRAAAHIKLESEDCAEDRGRTRVEHEHGSRRKHDSSSSDDGIKRSKDNRKPSDGSVVKDERKLRHDSSSSDDGHAKKGNTKNTDSQRDKRRNKQEQTKQKYGDSSTSTDSD